jgi:molecular chaperone GrpE
MIRKLMEDTLARHQVKTFSAKGQPFDPSLHEAMTAAETAELPPNHVFAEVLKGFTLNDRLVRPALVIVSRPVAAAPPAGSPPDAGPEGA